MKKILILFAHPAFHKSKINKKLLEGIDKIEGVTINHLYENYPDFFIHIKKEQQLLIEHDVIVWHHPFYWYSAPAILKEWMDLVLEHGFAYGKKGKALKGKSVVSVVTTGGQKKVYCAEGRNHYSINEFLVPYRQSASLCEMNYLPPFVIHGSHTISEIDKEKHAQAYKNLLIGLRDDLINVKDFKNIEYLNEIVM